LTPEKTQAVIEQVTNLKGMLESGADIAAIRDCYSSLENATFEIAEAMYGGDTNEGTAS
jgi:hypothetical protein